MLSTFEIRRTRAAAPTRRRPGPLRSARARSFRPIALAALGGLLVVAAAVVGRADEETEPDRAQGAPESGAARRDVSIAERLEEVWPQVADHSRTLPGENAAIAYDPGTGTVTYWAVGGLRREFRVGELTVRFRADTLVVTIPEVRGLVPGLRGVEAGDPEATEGAGEADDTDSGERPVDLADLPFDFYAEGNVRIEILGQGTTIGCDAFWFSNLDTIGVARAARVETTLTGARGLLRSAQLRDVRGTRPNPREVAGPGIPFFVSADVLTTTDFRSFRGEGVEVTHCDRGFPRVTVRASEVRVDPAEDESSSPPAAGGPSASSPGAGASGAEGEAVAPPRPSSERDEGLVGGAEGGRHFLIDLEETRLEVEGTGLLPLPVSYWDTRWNDWLPIRSVDLGSSSKFGYHAGVDWNLNFFLAMLPVDDAEFARRLIRRSRLDFTTEYLSKRGFGWGPSGIWGRSTRSWLPWQQGLETWEYYGEGRYYALRDDGEDRSAGGVEPPDPDRWWSSLYHRQAIPWLGTLDIEYSEWSDPNFLNEFWESIFKQEKEQENIFYLRRNFRDNMALTGLYKYRSNDFDSTVERLPEGRFRLYEQPVAGTGLYTDLTAQAANLRIRPADDLAAPSERYGRADLFNEWAYPVSWLDPWAQLRPFGFARYTAYEEVVDPAKGSEDRGAFGAGVTISQQWSGVFHTGKEGVLWDWFGIDAMKHVVVPKVSYRNTFSNDLEPSEVYGVDEVDSVRQEETVAVSLRQGLITRQVVASEGETSPARVGSRLRELRRQSYQQHHVLDSEVSFVVYPHPGRDNGDDSLSLVVLDNTLYPGGTFSLRSWIALDPNRDFRGERIETSVGCDLIPQRLSLTVGDVYSRATRGSGGEDTHHIYGLLSAYPDDKWRAQLFWSHDIESGRNAEISVTLGRIFRCFALLFEYSLDAGEDNGHSFSVNLQPVDIFTGKLFERGRRW